MEKSYHELLKPKKKITGKNREKHIVGKNTSNIQR